MSSSCTSISGSLLRMGMIITLDIQRHLKTSVTTKLIMWGEETYECHLFFVVSKGISALFRRATMAKLVKNLSSSLTPLDYMATKSSTLKECHCRVNSCCLKSSAAKFLCASFVKKFGSVENRQKLECIHLEVASKDHLHCSQMLWCPWNMEYTRVWELPGHSSCILKLIMKEKV